MSVAPPIPAFSRFPHEVLVRRAKTDADGYDTIVATLTCYIYHDQHVLHDAGFGQVVVGTHKLICDWDDAKDVLVSDEVVYTPSAGEHEHYVITAKHNPGKRNYNAEFDLMLRSPTE